jgi:hypothetical protein
VTKRIVLDEFANAVFAHSMHVDAAMELIEVLILIKNGELTARFLLKCALVLPVAFIICIHA